MFVSGTERQGAGVPTVYHLQGFRTTTLEHTEWEVSVVVKGNVSSEVSMVRETEGLIRPIVRYRL